MSLDRSLKGKAGLARHRNVLKRSERLAILTDDERWDESKSVFGLPKVAVRKVVKKKVEKKEEAAGAEAGAEGAAAAPAAAAPAKGAPAKGAAPAAKSGKGGKG
jgi:small basic protein (TIGR04137 family)